MVKRKKQKVTKKSKKPEFSGRCASHKSKAAKVKKLIKLAADKV